MMVAWGKGEGRELCNFHAERHVTRLLLFFSGGIIATAVLGKSMASDGVPCHHVQKTQNKVS